VGLCTPACIKPVILSFHFVDRRSSPEEELMDGTDEE